jgi:L,D-transpeptidase ErfK/SrfK
MTKPSKKIVIKLMASLLGICTSWQANALTFELPDDGSTIVGKMQEGKTIAGDTLSSIGRRYDLGIFELKEANPSLDLMQQFGPGKELVLPTEFILPDAVHKGIVINLAELRLYLYVPKTREVKTFPIGIGRQGWDSPVGVTYIANKTKDPTWVVPKTIMDARKEDGVDLPKSVPPGPDNPLGGYRLRLAVPSGAFLMHGSNDPSGIGRRSSSGCIRMQPEAIESIYNLIPVNTQVTIVDQPIKIGWLGNDLYLESHLPLQDDDRDSTALKAETKALIEKVIAKRPATIDWDAANRAEDEERGYPVKIGTGLDPIPQEAVPLNPPATIQAPKNQLHERKKKQSHATKTHWWSTV